MEMPGASSGSGSSSSGASGALDGLAFGKKIYYEHGAAAPAAGTSASSARKGKAAAAAQAARCQVEGCNLDLSDAKAYYSRHKVCAAHSKTPRVIVAGLEQRFCQQCSRFHLLTEFDQGKRSCRRRLAGHNERRRKPPRDPLSCRYGRLAPFYEPGRFRSFLLDFSYPRAPGGMRDLWSTMRTGDAMSEVHQWQGSIDPHYGTTATLGGANSPYAQVPAAAAFPSASGLPPGGCLVGVSDSSCALSLLSTQPWGLQCGEQTHVVGGYEGNAEAASSVMTNSCLASIAPHLQHAARLHVGDHCQFSGELELAMQRNHPHVDEASGSAFGHSGSGGGMNWSL